MVEERNLREFFRASGFQRTLNPVSDKSLFFDMANRSVFMLRCEALRLDDRRQASRRGFEAWILTSRKISVRNLSGRGSLPIA
ncbi:hypothetical protein TNCV_2915341 [Trichonephila clavipes]|nr:hypothetical protein TNCV_2915341 [Trichonephila clavipes]